MVTDGFGARSRTRNSWSSGLYRTDYAHIPLRKVVTPAGSSATYLHTSLRACEYQTLSKGGSCSSNDTFVSAVSKRTIAYRSDGMQRAHVTTFENTEALADGDEYTTTFLSDGMRHRLRRSVIVQRVLW